MGEFSIWHWLIVAAVVLLLFGPQKLPEIARNLGAGLREFKSAFTAGLHEEPKADAPAEK